VSLYYIRWDAEDYKIIEIEDKNINKIIEKDDVYKILFTDEFRKELIEDSDLGSKGKYYPLNRLTEKFFITFTKDQTFKTLKEAEFKLNKITKLENVKSIIE
jgi:hypothetical protein